MLGATWGFLFSLMQMLDPVVDPTPKGPVEIWPLNKGEKDDLARATYDYLQSFPQHEKNVFKVFLEKHTPLLSLCMAIGEVATPRFTFSYLVKKEQVRRASALENRNFRPGPRPPDESPGGPHQSDPKTNGTASASATNPGMANFFEKS